MTRFYLLLAILVGVGLQSFGKVPEKRTSNNDSAENFVFARKVQGLYQVTGGTCQTETKAESAYVSIDSSELNKGGSPVLQMRIFGTKDMPAYLGDQELYVYLKKKSADRGDIKEQETRWFTTATDDSLISKETTRGWGKRMFYHQKSLTVSEDKLQISTASVERRGLNEINNCALKKVDQVSSFAPLSFGRIANQELKALVLKVRTLAEEGKENLDQSEMVLGAAKLGSQYWSAMQDSKTQDFSLKQLLPFALLKQSSAGNDEYEVKPLSQDDLSGVGKIVVGKLVEMDQIDQFKQIELQSEEFIKNHPNFKYYEVEWGNSDNAGSGVIIVDPATLTAIFLGSKNWS